MNFRLLLRLLSLLIPIPLSGAGPVLIVADEIPAMEVLARNWKSRDGVETHIVKQDALPEKLQDYAALVVYIHKDIAAAAEKAFIDYALAGGKLVLLHHSISSGKRKNADWFQFLEISLPEGALEDGAYKYFDPVDFTVVNLAPDNYVTSHDVHWPTKTTYKGKDTPAFEATHTEIYLNHLFSGPRTMLLGVKYREPKSGKLYEQDTAGWYKKASKGLVYYFMLGHNASDFENPIYAQILANAIEYTPEK